MHINFYYRKSIIRLFFFLLLVPFTLKAQINTPVGARVPFGSNPGYGNGLLPTNLPTTGAFGKSQDAANAYNFWKNNYVVACPNGQFRVKFDDPNRTVSEGIAYGMLLAVYAADKALFDGLWAYYKANSNGNGIMHWRINGCSGVSGANGATDAELDASMALLLAENQWPTINTPYDYAVEATTLITKIRDFEMDHARGQAKNGDGWDPNSTCRNPSYQSPAYYRAFADHVPGQASFWNNAVNGGYALINNNAHATTGLVSDWSDVNGIRNTCNGGFDGYGYDACRFPWRMAQDVIWNNANSARTLCDRMTNYLKTQGANNVRGPVNQNGSGGGAHNATFVSTYALAVVGTTTANQAFMNEMYTRTVQIVDPVQANYPSGYFGNTLRAMSLFMMSGNFWKVGTTSQQDINVRVGSVNVNTGTTYDFQNVIQSGNKQVTFTIENLGAQTLNLTGSPRIAISGTNAALFSINQTSVPASLASNVSTTFVITFTPGSTGLKTATISIASNDPDENPYTIVLTGTGTVSATAPRIVVQKNGTTIAHNSTFAMGAASTGSPNTQRFEIRNTGDAPLNISSITATGAAYSIITPIPTSVAVGATGYVWVRATSAAAATVTGSFTVNTDDVTRPAHVVNLSAQFVACATAITTNEVFQDWDANFGNTTLSYVNPAWTSSLANPHVNDANSSYSVARFVRPATGTYSGVRYELCGTNNFVTLTAAKNNISMLVYSPAAGIPVMMNLKTNADVANTTTYPSRSSVKVRTTKTNQWERIYFDHSAAVGVTGIRNIEIFIDPGDVPNGD
ncbi:MAG: glycosyl hydrolase family 8, partial [Cytophagaceae bacterium]